MTTESEPPPVDNAARDPKDIAAGFPVPSPEIANRLVVLLRIGGDDRQ